MFHSQLLQEKHNSLRQRRSGETDRAATQYWDVSGWTNLVPMRTRTDSRTVSRAIQKLIWPVLREQGFDAFTSRAAWRHRTETIDVVAFELLGARIARAMGTTPHSFSVLLGTRLAYVPTWNGRGEVAKPDRPTEPECELRKMLDRQLNQPQLADATVWCVRANGVGLEATVEDALTNTQDALPWFDHFADPATVWHQLQTPRRHIADRGPFGIGVLGWPRILYLRGWVANRLGDTDTARRSFEELLASSFLRPTLPQRPRKWEWKEYGYYRRKRAQVEAALALLAQPQARV